MIARSDVTAHGLNRRAGHVDVQGQNINVRSGVFLPVRVELECKQNDRLVLIKQIFFAVENEPFSLDDAARACVFVLSARRKLNGLRLHRRGR